MGTYPPSPSAPDPVHGAVPAQVLGYQPPQSKVRPTSVTVLSVLGIVFASIAILNHASGILILLAGPAVMRGTGPLRAWNILNSLISLALAGVLLYSSIGCWKLRPWARRWIVSYAWVYLVWLVILAVIAFTWIMPTTMTALPAANTPQVAMAKRVAYASAILGLLLVSIFPIVLLVFMSRPTARTAFGETSDGSMAQPVLPPSPG